MGTESEDYGYLSFEQNDKQVLKNLADMGEQLKKLKQEMLEAEAKADAAKKAYEHYAKVVIPSEMFAAGIDSVSLSSGGTLAVKKNFYCQPNKNEADRKIIVDWLRANGGDHLVDHTATVSADDMQQLEDNHIPYIEDTTVNTNKLKSFLKDKIGASTGVQQIAIEDIPACIHFQEVITVELEMPK